MPSLSLSSTSLHPLLLSPSGFSVVSLVEFYFSLNSPHMTLLHCTFYTVHCTLYTIEYTLYTVHYTLYTVHCTIYTIHYILYTVHCTLYTVHCTMYILQCTLYFLHSTFYTIRSTLYILHSILHTVECNSSFIPATSHLLTVHLSQHILAVASVALNKSCSSQRPNSEQSTGGNLMFRSLEAWQTGFN